jgi:hypothetical protein
VVETLVHGERGLWASTRPHKARGHSRDRTTHRDRLEDNTASTDFGARAHFDVTENLRSSTDHDTRANFRVAITSHPAGSSKRNALQKGNVVFHHGGLTDDNTCAVVDHNATAEAGSWMDINAEYLRRLALQIEGQRAAILSQ